jgi:predicted RND superfamily exporter protein
VDLGLVLAKGVLTSLLTVIFLLPILTLLIYKPLEKFTHRSFMPSFKGFSKTVLKIGAPILILVALVVVPAFLAQSKNDFIYLASSDNGQGAVISQEFGKDEQMVLLVSTGDTLTEKALANELLTSSHITDIQSYVTTVGTEIPLESLPQETQDKLSSGGYSLMLLTIDTTQGTKEGFAIVETTRQTAEKYYGDGYYLAGTSASLYDMRDVVTADNAVTTAIAIIAISLIILITFKSPAMLVLLVGTIEISIWINLAVPYFMGSTVTYFGYMIISSVQLGATVDYAILYYGRYLEKRKEMGSYEASKQALSETAGSILTSALILCGAGTIISVISTQDVVSELGNLLGRGAALSALMVLFFLPNVIKLCDKLIKKTTYKSDFLEEAKQ